MARVFSYRDLTLGVPAPADVARIANEINILPAMRSGHAVLVGSAAWGDVSSRSDIDVVAYRCKKTEQLEADIERVRTRYESTWGHAAPHADVIWIGAEREDLVERDNLVSGSVPILEPIVISELFDGVSTRLDAHIRALATAKGSPWQQFANAYLDRAGNKSSSLLDLIGDYSAAMAAGWREHDWSSDGSRMTEEKLTRLGYVEGFAIHLSRLVLAHQDAYPVPDRRSDIRVALSELDMWGPRIESVLLPFFNFTIAYDDLAIRTRGIEPPTETEFDRLLSAAAAEIDFSVVEELVWKYRAENKSDLQ